MFISTTVPQNWPVISISCCRIKLWWRHFHRQRNALVRWYCGQSSPDCIPSGGRKTEEKHQFVDFRTEGKSATYFEMSIPQGGLYISLYSSSDLSVFFFFLEPPTASLRPSISSTHPHPFFSPCQHWIVQLCCLNLIHRLNMKWDERKRKKNRELFYEDDKEKHCKREEWWPKSPHQEGGTQTEGRVWWVELEWEGGGGQGHSISTISTIIPSVPAWADVGFSNQFHFHSWCYSGRAEWLPAGSLSSCPHFALGQSRGEGESFGGTGTRVLVDILPILQRFMKSFGTTLSHHKFQRLSSWSVGSE